MAKETKMSETPASAEAVAALQRSVDDLRKYLVAKATNERIGFAFVDLDNAMYDLERRQSSLRRRLDGGDEAMAERAANRLLEVEGMVDAALRRSGCFPRLEKALDLDRRPAHENPEVRKPAWVNKSRCGEVIDKGCCFKAVYDRDVPGYVAELNRVKVENQAIIDQFETEIAPPEEHFEDIA